ncbi:MAG: N-acetyltransferase [Candidatus Dormibacteraeota bacterium]|nr:N-acetyltransferase [Candidatus Dormibacteraeota bacterium]
MNEALIYPNVEIGAGTVLEPGVVIGVPAGGAEPGAVATRIGAGGRIRSGTIVYAGVVIGDAVNTGHHALIREDNVIGDDCSVGTHAVLEPGNRVGTGTRIHSLCFLEHVTVGQRVFLAPGVVFTDDPHPACPRYLDCVLGATLEDDVSIGGNVTVLPGVRIGAGALVGAGSVVTRNVEPGTVVAGNPAVAVKRVDDLRCFMGYFERPYEWRSPTTPTRTP